MFFNEAYAATLPIQGTDIAGRWDNLYNFLIWLSVFFFILVVGGMIYFAIRYHHQRGTRPKYMTGNHVIEAIWIVVPTILLMVIFGWGWSVYHAMTATPPDAYEIHVIAKQWLWQFQYDSGKTTVGEVFVPMNRPVKFIMTSEDVLHSFFVPNFRIKQDVVPGMYTSVWFEAKVPGKHQIFCAEYCGTSHSQMLGKVVALDDQQWKDWNNGKKLGAIPEAGHELTQEDIQAANVASGGAGTSLVDQGKALTESKGCIACHTNDGTAKIGPSYKGLFNSKVELADGSTVTADENYLRESIESPQAKLVKGFQPVMPTFKGVLSETEINAIIAYIKSLK